MSEREQAAEEAVKDPVVATIALVLSDIFGGPPDYVIAAAVRVRDALASQPVVERQTTEEMVERATLALVNELRRKVGLAPMTSLDDLDPVERAGFTADMRIALEAALGAPSQPENEEDPVEADHAKQLAQSRREAECPGPLHLRGAPSQPDRKEDYDEQREGDCSTCDWTTGGNSAT